MNVRKGGTPNHWCRHLALCNQVYLSGCSQFKQAGTRSNQLDLVTVYMVSRDDNELHGI